MIEYENLQKLNRPYLEELHAGFSRVLDGGSFILGTGVEEFERSWALHCRTRFCVGVANGMDALTLGLRSFSFKEGSEVIVPANTCIASILSILHAGLQPVLVEPDVATCTLDPNRAELAITKRTVAIMAVHLYGKSCSMDDLILLQKKHGLRLIEDCAQAHGASYKGKPVGSFGDLGAFSFYPTKNLGALGDAGCIVTNNTELYERLVQMRNYGSSVKNHHQIIGFNSRLDELQAVFLSVKLTHLEDMNARRRAHASIYDQRLPPMLMKPVVNPDYFDVNHVYHIRHKQRDTLRGFLLGQGVQTMIHYPTPPHKQPSLRDQLKGNYPITEGIHNTIMSLPISPVHTDQEIERVCDLIKQWIASVGPE